MSEKTRQHQELRKTGTFRLHNRLPRFNSGRGLPTMLLFALTFGSKLRVRSLDPIAYVPGRRDAAALKAGSALLYAGPHHAEQAIPR